MQSVIEDTSVTLKVDKPHSIEHGAYNAQLLFEGFPGKLLQLQQERGEKISAKPFTSFTRKHNLICGVTMLDRYSREEICEMAKTHISAYLDKQ